VDNSSELVATAAAYLGLAVFGALMLAVIWQFSATFRPWPLPMQRVRPISWQGIDVFMAFVVLAFIPYLVDESLRKSGFFDWLHGGPADKSRRGVEELWSMVLATPLELGLIILSLQQLRRTRLAELGITSIRASRNAALGYLLWLILTPLALAIYYVALQTTPKEWVEEHPIARVAEQPLAIPEWVLLLLVTVGLAPLLEETVFRGILLPWQLRGGWMAQVIIVLCAFLFALVGGVREEGKAFNPAPAVFIVAVLPAVLLAWLIQSAHGPPQTNPSSPAPETMAAAHAAEPRVFAGPPEETAPAWPELSTPAMRIEEKLANLTRSAGASRAQPGSAILVNGLFFAAMHSTIWPSPIPLFLLGVGLAWIRYRTSSLVGALTVHSLFNAVAALALVLEHAWS
jgi:membrane protease YdiL (CAAX protease family)